MNLGLVAATTAAAQLSNPNPNPQTNTTLDPGPTFGTAPP